MSKKILPHIRMYTSSTILKQLITLVATVLTRRFLGPLQTGIWSVLQIILSYATYASLGVTDSVSREIPAYRGKNDHETVDAIKDNASTFAVLGSLVVAAGVIIFALCFQASLSREMFLGLMMTSVLVVLQRLNNLLIALLRAYQEFEIASRQMIASSVVNAFLVAILSYYFRIYGFMWAMALSFIFTIVYIRLRFKVRVKFRLEKDKLKDLTGYGIPLMMIGLISTVFLSVDKIMIAKFLGLELLGYYSLAVLAYNYLASIPNAVGVVMVPHLHVTYGAGADEKAITRMAGQWAYVFCYLLPVMIAFVWIFAGALIELLLPQFTPSIPSVRYLILAAYFLSLNQPFDQLLITIRRHMILFPIAAVSVVLSVVLNWVAIHNGHGIAGVAVATSVVLFLKFSMTYFALISRGNRRELLMEFGRINLKFILFLLLLAVSQWMCSPIANSWLRALLQYATVVLVYLPFLLNMKSRLAQKYQA